MGWQDDPVSAPAPTQRGWADDPVVSPPPRPSAERNAEGIPEITIRPAHVEERMRAFAPPGFGRAVAGNEPNAETPAFSPPTPKPPEDKGPGHALLQGHYDAEAANIQGAGNIVRDRNGEYVRKPIGEIEEYDFGPMIRGQDGKVYSFNPKTDVMFKDPASGKLMAFERDKDIDNPGLLARIWNIVAPGMATVAPTRLASSNAIPLATQRGAALGFPVGPKTAATGERMRDAAAFAELGQEPFAPAFRSKGAARFARTVEEMPIIGGIVKGPKTETETALRDAQSRIAEGLGAARSDEQAGRTLQTGLDRFRTAGVQRVEPGVLENAGIPARAPVQPLPDMSAGARRTAQNAAPIRADLGGGIAQTSRGTQVQAARPLNEVILARRNVEDMSDAELQTLIRSPASKTSFAVRQEALYESAHRKVPSMMKVDGSRNAGLIATPNAALVARGLQKAEESARIKGGALEGRFGKLVQDLQNSQSGFTLDSLKSARTEIGRALASFGNYDARLDRSQLKSLYGAISRDYEVGLQTIANRAYERTKLGNNRPDAVTADAARAADRALYEMRRADRYTRVSMERMDRFTNLLNASSPEAAVRSLATRMKEGTIDRGMIRAVRDALRPEEREQILGYLVARMGQGRAGSKEAEQIWNIHAFATDWNRNKDALGLMMEGVPPQVRRQLDALAQVSDRMKYYETTKNYSGTAYSGMPLLSLATGMMTGGWTGVATMIGQVGGAAALGKFLTNPQYLNWMVRAARTSELEMARGPQVAGSRWPVLAGQIEKIAANDNELGPVIAEALAIVNRKAVNAEREEPNNGGNRK